MLSILAHKVFINSKTICLLFVTMETLITVITCHYLTVSINLHLLSFKVITKREFIPDDSLVLN